MLTYLVSKVHLWRRLHHWLYGGVRVYARSRFTHFLTYPQPRNPGDVLIRRSIELGKPIIFVNMNYRYASRHLRRCLDISQLSRQAWA